ncbi:TetR/AcrR family transcriptional regulator [Nonomuraea rubra]|uniref:TetR/AcrR family transcriptional regulator n=1 Tax=Nonomuraea rubra TaxID=46180 RepID=UPI00360F4427
MRIGGRPRQIETADIVRAGRELGLRDLSMNAVAARLGVSSTALYRHVDGRWELERLVGESILAGLDFHDDPAHGPVRHLLSFALELRGFILRHPGLAAYVQTLFPRGEGAGGCSPWRPRRWCGAVIRWTRRSCCPPRWR